MNEWLLSLVHALLWSMFSIVIWLSKQDHLQSKFILFLLFLFLAIRIGAYFQNDSRKSIVLVCMNTFIFFSGKYLFVYLIYIFD